MEDLRGPQTQVVEGAYAIKVSMRCSYHVGLVFKGPGSVHGPYVYLVTCNISISGNVPHFFPFVVHCVLSIDLVRRELQGISCYSPYWYHMSSTVDSAMTHTCDNP